MNGHSKSKEPELANGWPVSRVEGCMSTAAKDDLVTFIRQRYEERFLNAIRALRSAPGQQRGYGFAIMALGSLLIESLQCYRYGLPTTNRGEYDNLAAFRPPPECEIPMNQRKNGRQAFEDFFSLPQHQPFFPNVDGGTFYAAIRNGLLHQAQTKLGWRIRTGQAMLWDASTATLDRNMFSDALACAFKDYTDELTRANWTDDIWLKARRKLWWVMALSA